MQNREIKSIRTYQAVKVDNNLDTFFTSASVGAKRSVKMSLEDHGVLIETATDSVLVPFPNISGVYFLTEHDVKKNAEKQAADAHYEATKTIHKVSKVKVDPVGAKRL